MTISKIDKGWTMRSLQGGASHTADLPATVADILYRSGEMPDPYYRENEWGTFELLKQDYEFTNSFVVTPEQLAQQRNLLVFEGLDTVVDIYLNDRKLCAVNNMHRTYRLDVTDTLVAGDNKLRLHFYSNINYALELHRQDPYYTTSDTVDGFSMVRKSHSSYGWDWGPQLPDMGIWRMVSLVSYSTASIEEVYIQQQHLPESVNLVAKLQLERLTDAPLQARLTVTTPDGGHSLTTEAVVTGDTEALTLAIDNPQLWWCNGFGKQPLYSVELTLSTLEGTTLDSRTLQVGLRTLTMRCEQDQWGESFELHLNGASIFAMGANYIPEDSIYPRCSRERTDKLLRQCVAANYNCIRVWGGGYFCDDWFYELCDQYGIMVWQDMLFACGVYRLKEGFVDNVVAEVQDNVRRLRHHASIALWCGNNELEWGWSGWDMGFGNDPRDRADYIKLFEWVLPETVKQLDPDRFYWLASPSSGGSFDNPNDQNRGDVHYWEVWHRLKHFTEYRKYHFRFCSEFGFQSFPCEKTIDTFTLPEDRNIFSPVMENHQKNGTANGRILFYLSDNFQYPTSFSALIFASQILQAEAIKYGVEHWRSNRGRCMGALYWQVNDCWQVASWSSIDYFGRWKPLHYYAKRFYAPLLLSALEEHGMVRFVVSNETMEQADCQVCWELHRNTGELLEQGTTDIAVAALTATEACSTDYSSVTGDKELARSCYLRYTLVKAGQQVSSSTLLFVRPKHFAFCDPGIAYTVVEEETSFILTFSTTSFAKYVTIDSSSFDFVASDNCFDLSAGCPVTISIDKQELSRAVTIKDFDELSVLSAIDIR